ncbi:CAAD domain-containing protein [Synechococcus sp. BS55D]|uniref:CAAD domain-containing protein n=1 Tax=Synechococcus sp. BS55D TaxID=2055943 RepID=UPI00103C1D42|nr:CAAD domain-containing protein [Synechococcus sp. BS55D]TCD56491.1 hypothetical protein CWE16_09050 [Synechococcus sp. BS55D]
MTTDPSSSSTPGAGNEQPLQDTAAVPSEPTPSSTPETSTGSSSAEDTSASSNSPASLNAAVTSPTILGQESAAATEPAASIETAVTTPPLDPAIASRVTVPAAMSPDPGQADLENGEGGEWDLLSEKLRSWWQEQDLDHQWQRLRQPLLLGVGLVGLILVIRIYSGILAAIATVPLAPRLFELAGVSWLAWFSVTRLVRSDERRKVLTAVSGRWQAFRGGGKG